MPDSTAQLMGVDANGDSGTRQPRDAYSELLGESGGNPVSRYFAHTAARNSGQALDAARDRYRTQQTQLGGLQQQIDAYSASGLTSGFTPEIEKAYTALGGNKQLFQASRQQALAVAGRRQQLREDHAKVFGAYQDKYGGGAAAPAAGAAPGATTSAGPTASTGSDGSALVSGGDAGQVTPASTGASGLHPLHPQYDWQNHIANEPPEEAQMHSELKELQQAAIASEGLPEHEDIVNQLKSSAAIYGKLLDLRLGFGQKSALQGQKDTASMERAQVGHQATGKASIENRNASLHERVDTQAATYASKGFGSEGEAQAAADLLNGQRRRANQHGKENEIDPVNQFFQVKKATNNKLFPDAYTIEPTDTDPTAPKSDGGQPAAPTSTAAAPAPKKIQTLSQLEGMVIPGSGGKPDLIIRNGKPEPYDPANAR
jgi:hypothetical protein